MRIGIHSQEILKERCLKLVKKMKNNFPCADNVMDVWIADEVGDLVLEFNSFGIIGNSYLDFCDIELYLDGECNVII